MRKATDDLHRLIRSLTPLEKGYFKRFARTNDPSPHKDYLVLFDAMNRMKIYDQQILINKLAGTKLVKNLAWSKHNLYQQIMKVLRSYHQGSSATRVRNHLHDSEILTSKGLLGLAIKSLGAARKTAERYEDFHALMEINRSELRIRASNQSKSASEADMKRSYDELVGLMEKYGNACEYDQLRVQVVMKLSHEGAHNPDSTRLAMKNIIDRPLMQQEQNAVTFLSRCNVYTIKGAYYYSIGDYEQAYAYMKKNMELFESSHPKIKDLPNGYAGAVNNLIIVQIQLRRFREAAEMLNKMGRFSVGTYAIKHSDMAKSLKLELLTCAGQFQKALAVYESVKNRMVEVMRLDAQSSLQITYFGALSFFGCGRFNEAAKLLSQLINEYGPGFRIDIQAAARIVKLLCHLEAGDTEHLPYAVKSTYRFLKSRERLTGVERVVVDFMRNDLPRIPAGSKAALISSLEALRNQLAELISDRLEAKSLEYFDFMSWIESKIERRSFAEIVQSKAGMA